MAIASESLEGGPRVDPQIDPQINPQIDPVAAAAGGAKPWPIAISRISMEKSRP
jgi:hypothetical protein